MSTQSPSVAGNRDCHDNSNENKRVSKDFIKRFDFNKESNFFRKTLNRTQDFLTRKQDKNVSNKSLM